MMMTMDYAVVVVGRLHRHLIPRYSRWHRYRSNNVHGRGHSSYCFGLRLCRRIHDHIVVTDAFIKTQAYLSLSRTTKTCGDVI